MRHNRRVGNLSRTSPHRKAMLANMASSLIIHKRINTTVPKAKTLKMYIEPIITKAKVDSTHSRRTAFRYLRNKEAVMELFRTVSPAVGDRPGGYTRILKTEFRKGDGADMCFIELVDFNETYTQESTEIKPRTRRGGGRGKKAGDAPKQQAAQKPQTKETPIEETQETQAENTVAEAKQKATEESKSVEVQEESKKPEIKAGDKE